MEIVCFVTDDGFASGGALVEEIGFFWAAVFWAIPCWPAQATLPKKINIIPKIKKVRFFMRFLLRYGI